MMSRCDGDKAYTAVESIVAANLHNLNTGEEVTQSYHLMDRFHVHSISVFTYVVQTPGDLLVKRQRLFDGSSLTTCENL